MAGRPPTDPSPTTGLPVLTTSSGSLAVANDPLLADAKPTIPGLDAFLHAYAREALGDGGIYSQTWHRMKTPIGYLNCMAGLPQGESHRLEVLYRILGQGQALRGWTDMPAGRVRRLAKAGQLADADDLPGDLRQSPVYRAWWLHHGLPISRMGPILRNQPEATVESPSDTAGPPDNPKLKAFVFPGAR